MIFLENAIILSVGYFFGCFQSSYIFVKAFKKKDIRSVGSGNAGTMNTFLSFGENLGAVVLFCDILKTIIPSILCVLLFNNVDTQTTIAVCSLGVFLGHCFPFWLKFKGGKGVAVAVAFALTLDLRVFAVSIVISGIFGLLTKSATYGSYTFAIMLFVSSVTFGHERSIIVSAFLQSALIVLLHLLKKRPVPAETVKN